jgi:hypothetical protein
VLAAAHLCVQLPISCRAAQTTMHATVQCSTSVHSEMIVQVTHNMTQQLLLAAANCSALIAAAITSLS